MKAMHMIKPWFILAGILLLPAADATPADRLTLQQSIDLALQQSVLIQSAREGVQGAEAQRKEAFTGFLPKFSTSYNYTRLSEEPVFLLPGPPPVSMTTGTQNNYTWALEVRQPLFAGGGIKAAYDVNRIGAQIARMDEAATVQDLVQEVKVAYFNILKAERLLEVARQGVDQINAHRDMTQNFFDVGMVPRNDVLRAEVELANGNQTLLRAENALEMARAKFNTILRRDMGAPAEVVDILTLKPFPTPLSECLRLAREGRPEIQSTALKVQQSQQTVKVVRSEYFPSLNAVGHYERFGDTPGVAGSPYKDQENWYVMGVATWNFWEWGRTKYRVDASRSRENQLAYALENLRDQVALEVKSAWLALQEAEKQVAVAKRAIEQAEENYRISRERYREQVGTSTDVLDAQTLLTRARSDYFNALGDYNISQARLERAMGVKAW